jgi:predicted RNA-binding Zn-ribbon protein involved in translation (DUF1610 family)
VTRCSDCGAEVPPDEPGVERRPCPNCGSLARTVEASSTATIGVTASTETAVERAVNEARMTAFAVIFGTALSVGLAVGFATCAWLGVLAGVVAAVGTALLLAAIHRLRFVRQLVMELMHRITGQ